MGPSLERESWIQLARVEALLGKQRSSWSQDVRISGANGCATWSTCCKRRSMTTAPYIPNVAKTYQIEQYEMNPSRTLTWLCKSWLPFVATSIVTPSSALWHLSACQPFWSQHCSLKFHPLWGPVPRPFPSALPHLGSEIGPCLPEDHQSTFRNLFISEELGLYVHPSKRKYNPRGVDNK